MVHFPNTRMSGYVRMIEVIEECDLVFWRCNLLKVTVHRRLSTEYSSLIEHPFRLNAHHPLHVPTIRIVGWGFFHLHACRHVCWILIHKHSRCFIRLVNVLVVRGSYVLINWVPLFFILLFRAPQRCVGCMVLGATTVHLVKVKLQQLETKLCRAFDALLQVQNPFLRLVNGANYQTGSFQIRTNHQ